MGINRASLAILFTTIFLSLFYETLAGISERKTREERQTSINDPRSALGAVSIGPSFRSKRDQDGVPSESPDIDLLIDAEKNIAAGEDDILKVLEHVNHLIDSKDNNDKNEDIMEDGETSRKEPLEPLANSNYKESVNYDKSTKIEVQDQEHETLSNSDFSKDNKLRKLMSESSELAKELRMVFEILAKREAQLVEEMTRLKLALTGAVAVLTRPHHDGNHEDTYERTKRLRREYSSKDAPYKACVYIESSDDNSNSEGSAHIKYSPNIISNVYPPEPKVGVLLPGESVEWNSEPTVKVESYKPENNILNTSTLKTHSTSESGEDVDLSKVYWLKLPDSAGDHDVQHKFQEVFSKVSGDGRDVLIIPVSKSLATTQDVSNGFLNAVRVKKSAMKSKYFRKLRSLKIHKV